LKPVLWLYLSKHRRPDLLVDTACVFNFIESYLGLLNINLTESNTIPRYLLLLYGNRQSNVWIIKLKMTFQKWWKFMNIPYFSDH